MIVAFSLRATRNLQLQTSKSGLPADAGYQANAELSPALYLMHLKYAFLFGAIGASDYSAPRLHSTRHACAQPAFSLTSL
jgi:hypothetical protein